MSDTTAKNIGTIINDPSSVNVTNVFEGEKPQPLPSNIPAAKGFIGREEDLNALREAKKNGRTSFVLHGTGGVGKTELALKFIEEIKGEFQAHIRVDMQGLANALSPDDAMLEVIRWFEPNVPSLPPEQIESLYISLLNEHKPLLFFDNARDRNQIEPLNQSAAFVIVTSRESFKVTGGHSEEIEQMLTKDAIDLLYSIASEKRFDGKADELAQLAGCLPMALLPLASILAEDKTIKVAYLIKRYSDRKERLRLADPNRKNLSVETSFDLSCERLSDELKERWRKLAVFPADFALEVLKALWQDENAEKALSDLVRSNLVIFDEESERSRLHDLARDYTREKLSDKELFQAEALHAAYYGWFLARLKAKKIENLASFDQERINVETGFSWLKDKVLLLDAFASICTHYTGYANEILLLRLHRREYIKWIEVGLSASRKIGDRNDEGNHLGNLGYAYDDLGECSKAIEYYEQALTIIRETNNRVGENATLSNLAAVYIHLGENKKAVKYCEEALIIAKEIGDRNGEGMCLGNIGIAYGNLGEPKKVIEYCEQALVIAKEIGDRQFEGMWLGNLGVAYKRLSEVQKSIEHHEAALKIAKEMGDKFNEGNQLGNLGVTYADSGEMEKAIVLWKEAVRILEEIESPYADTYRQNLVKAKAE